MLRLTIIEEPDGEKPDSATLVVGPAGATVGRTKENNWTLPDQQNLLSRSHFEILFESGSYRLLDRSTNGTFVNDEKSPIGRGKSVPIKEGDVIGLGAYKIEVQMEAINAAPEPVLGERPAFFGTGSDQAPLDLDAAEVMPAIDSGGTADAGDIADAFSAIEPQQIPDKLFNLGSATPSTNSVETAGLSDREIDQGPLIDGSGPGPRSASDLGMERPPEPVPAAAQDRPGLFVPVVSTPQSPPEQEQAAPDFSTPAAGDDIRHRDDSFPAPPPAAVDNNSAAGAIPEDWLLEVEDPSPAAPVVNAPKPRANAAVAPSGGNFNEAAVPPRQSPAATPAPTPPSGTGDNDLELGIRRAVAGALGDQANAMGHRELVRVVEEMSAMVQACAPALMGAMSSRTQFKDHMRLDRTMVRAQDNNPLKFCTDPSDALARMLLNDQPGLLQGRLAVGEAFRQLAAHQTALFAALQPALEETVEKFSPAAIEAAAREEGGIGFSLSSGKGKLWDCYQQIYARLADSERGRLEEFFMKSLAQHYERSLATLG